MRSTFLWALCGKVAFLLTVKELISHEASCLPREYLIRYLLDPKQLMRDRDPFGPDTAVSRAADFAELVHELTKIPLSPRLEFLIEKWNHQRSIDRCLPGDSERLFE